MSLHATSAGKSRPVHRRSGEIRRLEGYAALGILLFAGLNLNGVLLLLTRREGLLSPVVLLAAVILCLRCFKFRSLTPAYAAFMAFMASFLWSGLIASLASNTFEPRYLSIYSATAILVSGLYFWLASQEGEELDAVLRRLKLILLVTCAFGLVSGYLSEFFSYVAPTERASGLFENPNEAAVAALYCLVLIAAYPAASPLVTLGQVALAVSALVLTFSKAGIIMLFLLGAALLITRRSLPLFVVAFAAFGALFWALSLAFHSDLIVLTGEQRERFADLLNIFGGDLDARTTTGRTELWQFGLERIAAVFPFGAGLGQFHAMEGGYRNSLQEWLGIHNTYLMILGEAGLVPFVLFILFLATVLINGLRSRRRLVVGGFALVLLGDMLGTHGVLGFRLANVVLAVMMAIAVRSEGRSLLA